MICITMTYEGTCATARAAAAVAGNIYAPHTLVQYLSLMCDIIDRVTHQASIIAVATALAGSGLHCCCCHCSCWTAPDTQLREIML